MIRDRQFVSDLRSFAICLCCLALPAPALAGSVTYYRFGNTVYGSDGSKAHDFAGTTYVTPPPGSGRKPYRCHRFAGSVTCRD